MKSINSIKEQLKIVTILIQITPSKGELYYQRGDLYFDLEEYKNAVFDFEKAISLNYTTADVWYLKGLTYDRLGNKEKAISDYKASLQLDSTNAMAYNNIGHIYMKQWSDLKAEKYFKLAMEVDSEHSKSRNNLGMLYVARNQYKAAITLFSQAIQINRSYANAYANRAYAYFITDQYQEAWEDVTFTLDKLRVGHPRAHALRGYLRYIKATELSGEELKLISQDLLIALKIGGQHPVPLFFYAKILKDLGEEEQAMKNIRFAMELIVNETDEETKNARMKELISILRKKEFLELLDPQKDKKTFQEVFNLLGNESENTVSNIQNNFSSTLEANHLMLKKLPFEKRKMLQDFLIGFMKIESKKDALNLKTKNPFANLEEAHNLIENMVISRCKPIEKRIRRNLAWLK